MRPLCAGNVPLSGGMSEPPETHPPGELEAEPNIATGEAALLIGMQTVPCLTATQIAQATAPILMVMRERQPRFSRVSQQPRSHRAAVQTKTPRACIAPGTSARPHVISASLLRREDRASIGTWTEPDLHEDQVQVRARLLPHQDWSTNTRLLPSLAPGVGRLFRACMV